jgi:hypothetical protein
MVVEYGGLELSVRRGGLSSGRGLSSSTCTKAGRVDMVEVEGETVRSGSCWCSNRHRRHIAACLVVVNRFVFLEGELHMLQLDLRASGPLRLK